MAPIIGIDLGTTKSVLAVWTKGEPVIIPDPRAPQGLEHLTPSVVAFDPLTQQWVVGHDAVTLTSQEPDNAISAFKRFMGRRFSDKEVQENVRRRHLLYKIGESRRVSHGIAAVVEDRELMPQEVAAKILAYLKRNAEAYLGESVIEAVITVPAYFNDAQRQATKDAAKIAGLTVRQVLNEPTAACLAYNAGREHNERRNVAVYDLGGGTFDISILSIGGGLPLRVLSTNGDTFLGGEELNWLIVEWALGHLDDATRHRAQGSLPVLAALRSEAEAAKRRLSAEARVAIPLPDDVRAPDGAAALELERTTLESLADEWIGRTLGPCRNALRDAQIGSDQIGEVLLVGGQTRMPAVQRAVETLFGVSPDTSLHPEQVVGLGAAVRGGILSDVAGGLKLADVVPLSLGLNAEGRMDVVIKRNTPTPVRRIKSYSTTKDDQPAVDIEVYQGEAPAVANNVLLGTFRLEIELAARGEPEIEVAFNVDGDGILNVTARDMATKNMENLTISNSLRLSDSDLSQLTAELQKDEARTP